MREELKMRDRDVDMQQRRERIRESRYHKDYERLITREEPKYLKRENGNERKIIGRFRCGNEENDNRFWLEEDARRCRMCREEAETMKHMMKCM